MINARRRNAAPARGGTLRHLSRGLRKHWQLKARGVDGFVRDRLAPWSRMPLLKAPDRIVFVCKGNICRSVFAEHYYRQLDPGLTVHSVGVDVRRPSGSPEVAVEVAREFDIDLTQHRSRPLAGFADTPGTLYIVMEPWHARSRMLDAPRREGRVHCLGRWGQPSRAVIKDPYGSSAAGFRACFQSLAELVKRLRQSVSPETSPEPVLLPASGNGHRGLPATVKRRLLQWIISPGMRWVFRPWATSRVPIIMLHRFSAHDEGPSKTSAALLDRCLAFVRSEGIEALALGDLCERLATGTIPRRAVCFTVDDGYRDFGEVAFPLFQRHRVPVTVFIASAFIDGAMWYWWDHIRYIFATTDRQALQLDLPSGARLELAWQDPATKKAAYRSVVEACKNIPHDQKERLMASLERELRVHPPREAPPDFRGLGWDEVRDLSQRGVEFGGHTVTHPILAQISVDRQRREVLDSLEAIERRTGIRPRTFSYPNGRARDLGEAVGVLRDCPGVAGAVTVERAIVSRKLLSGGVHSLYSLPRMPMPGTYERFVSLLSGLTAVKMSMGLE